MASYFWVGGSGTWDNTAKTNWATTSGGAGGFGPPTSADTVTFDANSGTGTCTTSATAAVLQLTLNSSTLALTLGANLSGINTFTYTLGTLNLASYTLSCVVVSSSNTNVRTLNFGTGNITVTGNSVSVWNTGNLTNFSYTGTPTVNCSYSGSVGTRTIAAGVVGGTEANALDFNITAGTDIVSFTGVSNRNVNFTGFAGTCSSTTRTFYGSLTGSSGMTWASGAGITTFAATSGVRQITTSGKTWDFPLAFNGAGGVFAFQDALTQGSTRAFTITNGTVCLKSGVTTTVGSFATVGTNRKYLQSTTTGSRATLSQSSGTVNASYLTIQDVNATGGATWNALYSSNNIDAGNNLGWNFGDSPQTVTEVTYTLRSFTTPRRF